MAVGIIRATYGAGYAYPVKTQPLAEESYAETKTQPLAEESYAETLLATRQAEREDGGKVLGITTFLCGNSVSYGMAAQYAAESTKEEPVVKVVSGYGGKTEVYYVHVNEVNPKSATQLEMFALLAYADDQGLTDAGSFGSYHYLKLCAENAEKNGYLAKVSGYENFLQVRHDWIEAIRRMEADYSEARLHEQARTCGNLRRTMEAVRCKRPVQKNRMAGEEKAEKTKESTKESTKKSTDAAAALFGRTPERVRKSEDEEREERRAFLSAYIEEQLEKWEKGEIKELSFQIGARLFTEQEWDVLLEKFDAAMESIRESMRQELERIKAEEQREKERLEREAAKEALQREAALRAENAKLLSEALFAAESSLLLAETTVCTYPSTDFCKAGRCYIICYTKEQITCKGGGTAGSREWSVPFENALQYESTMEFLSRFPKGKNLRFAAHKGFWEDFLQDGIDADRFCAFFEEMEADGPGVFAIAGDAMYSCQEKEEWMQYMNPPKESVLG